MWRCGDVVFTTENHIHNWAINSWEPMPQVELEMSYNFHLQKSIHPGTQMTQQS